MKRAKELELVVEDKRAKRKESRVLDSNGESGALRGHFLSCERGAGEGVMNFNGGKKYSNYGDYAQIWKKVDKNDFYCVCIINVSLLE